MISRMPLYYKNFKCTASECSDNCCIGWEIDIDDSTASFYDSVQGDFGERLRKNIAKGECDSFILGENERCPFLNEKNLCDIIINLGEDKLCHICTHHPRYYEWIGNVREGGIGLCCEEAARIILSHNQPFDFYECEIGGDSDCEEYSPDEKLTELIYSARNVIIRHLENTDIPLENAIADVWEYSCYVQQLIDNGDYTIPAIESSDCTAAPDIKQLLITLSGLEINNPRWLSYLEELIRSHKDNCFILPDTEPYLRKIAVYFVWRYLIKAVFDEEIIPKIYLMAVSIFVTGYMLCQKEAPLSLEDCALLFKDYSKEIEYSEDNLSAVFDMAYNNPSFRLVKAIENPPHQ